MPSIPICTTDLFVLLWSPQISVNQLEPEIAMATDCKVVTYNKGLWAIATARHIKTGPAAHRGSNPLKAARDWEIWPCYPASSEHMFPERGSRCWEYTRQWSLNKQQHMVTCCAAGKYTSRHLRKYNHCYNTTLPGISYQIAEALAGRLSLLHVACVLSFQPG